MGLAEQIMDVISYSRTTEVEQLNNFHVWIINNESLQIVRMKLTKHMLVA